MVDIGCAPCITSNLHDDPHVWGVNGWAGRPSRFITHIGVGWWLPHECMGQPAKGKFVNAERNTTRTGCVGLALAGIIILIPLVGDVACTVFIVTDDLTLAEKVLWLAAVWLVPWIGRLFYLLIGQKRNRLLNA